ncbi:hypothetical protein AYI69_g4216 [Smittium culicis]|nr:hypothetical protein AYI69_g4216 [Smittium culicis]
MYTLTVPSLCPVIITIFPVSPPTSITEKQLTRPPSTSLSLFSSTRLLSFPRYSLWLQSLPALPENIYPTLPRSLSPNLEALLSLLLKTRLASLLDNSLLDTAPVRSKYLS